jgi:hypothetical protein
MIEENPYRSQKKIAETLSLHHNVAKGLITEELNLQQIKFKRVPHTLTANLPLEKVKISLKLSGSSTNFKSTISPVSSGRCNRGLI